MNVERFQYLVLLHGVQKDLRLEARKKSGRCPHVRSPQRAYEHAEQMEDRQHSDVDVLP